MKKKTLLAAIAVTGIVAYLVRKKMASKNGHHEEEHSFEPGSTHLTNAFSKAKKIATGVMG